MGMKPETKIPRSEYPVIKELIQTHTLQEIADKYGASRERVRQILKTMGITKVFRRFVYTCQTCGKRFTKTKSLPITTCSICRQYEAKHAKPGTRKYHRRFEIKACWRCGLRRGNRGNGLCMNCSNREYYKTPRGKEAIRQYQETHREHINKYARTYYQSHKEEFRLKNKKWVEKNREYVREYQKQRRIKKLLAL